MPVFRTITGILVLKPLPANAGNRGFFPVSKNFDKNLKTFARLQSKLLRKLPLHSGEAVKRIVMNFQNRGAA
jgi:hypothetical protein